MAGDRRYSRLGAKRSDLESALVDRLKDAECLIAGERSTSAIAMGLYALEIALKIAICRKLDLDALPIEFQIHDLEGLLILSGLYKRVRDVEVTASKIKSNWDYILNRYKSSQVNELRYSSPTHTPRQAKDFLRRLQDPSHGLLPWLSAQS